MPDNIPRDDILTRAKIVASGKQCSECDCGPLSYGFAHEIVRLSEELTMLRYDANIGGAVITLAQEKNRELEAENQRLLARLKEWEDAVSKMSDRAAGMRVWLLKVSPHVCEEQQHLDEGSAARAYWHYGAFSALTDAIALFAKTKDQKEQGNAR